MPETQRPGRQPRISRTTAIGFALFVAVSAIGLGVGVAARHRPPPPTPIPSEVRADVAVYGGTAGGIMAAISAARSGATVVLIERTRWLGGMVTSGLGATDVASRTLVGGLTREFYTRIGAVYDVKQFGERVAWYHEPHVATDVFEAMLADAGVQVLVKSPLDRSVEPERTGSRLTSIRLTTGTTVFARVFVDATYEGDLMAAAGVPFTVGREASSKYGESLAGVTRIGPVLSAIEEVYGRHYANDAPIDDMVTTDSLVPGSGDGLVQPYNYRLCVTNVPTNRLEWVAPPSYDRSDYLIVERALQAWLAADAPVDLSWLVTITPLPNGKGDLNNSGLYSTDLLGGISAGWAEATDAERAKIATTHRWYEKGFLYFVATDEVVPVAIRDAMNEWGMCRDEFTTSSNWPPQLYVREARRMVSDVVLTQADVQVDVQKADPVGIGTYRIDGHAVRRVLESDGFVRGEGGIHAPTKPYEIPYSILVPPPSATTNLLVIGAVSASHVAFASLRMEVNFMAMGDAAGAAAAIAAHNDIAVGAVPYFELARTLTDRGALLELP